MSAAVDRLYGDFVALTATLGEAEPSLLVSADETFRKALLLAAASYFETRIVSDLIDYAESESNELLTSFIRNKALSRQYHTMFDWENQSANKFFALFGDGFKQFIKKVIADDTTYGNAIDAFMELGSDRNRLVHQNYAVFTLEKTTKDIFTRYEQAKLFAETFPDRLRQYLAAQEVAATE